jgi:maltose alpha-D-glucosyltransferase/alpha-amylase
MDNCWYKDAVFYELHIRAFMDSNGDGIGDIEGLTSRLEYLHDLGITCIWLLPMYPSPGRDDGYDIMDYYTINPEYGTLEQFRTMLDKAHALGMRVIADLVLNHTSDQHPWFLEAKKGPDNPYHDYNVWTDDPEYLSNVRIIFCDTEESNWAWAESCKRYYWHRFFHHQPDLNYNNPVVQEEMLKVVRFWLKLGLDGFRADAVPYLFVQDGTSCENLPENTCLSQAHARADRQGVPRPDFARRGQSVARGSGPVFRGGRRVSHGLQFSVDAAHVHGAQTGASRADRGHHPAHSGDPGELSVGDLPPQS